jgi:hypothetical protein
MVTLNEANAYLEGPHRLSLTNDDGQTAVSTFPIDPLKIEPVELVEAVVPLAVTVTGKNFGVGTTAVWKNAAGLETTIPEADVEKKSDEELVIKLVPGLPGEGQLTVISKIGLKASAKANVKPKT